jgi:hypothetical protein
VKNIVVKDKIINVTGVNDEDYISLTDLARFLNEDDPRYPIQNWMRLKDTIDFIGLWEILNNENFNRVEFDAFKLESGKNSFVMTPTKWISKTNAIGIKTKAGKYGGGTFAHRDIALEFASWISPEVKLYIIKEFQRLKLEESEQMEWQGKRLLTKINYLIHTDAIKTYLIPIELTDAQKSFIYASEADMLNVALFGMRAKEWKDNNPDKKGNIRDYASTIELAILSNLEYHNSLLIKDGIVQKERLIVLNKEANREKELFNKNNVKVIEGKNE